MKIKVDKEVDEVRFLTILKKDGTGRIVFNVPNVKQFERPLTETEVAHGQYLTFSVSEGSLVFGDIEPGDVLSEAVSNAGLIEDQAAMILSLTSERDTAARAAANANEQFESTSQELEAVRKRLREVTQTAVDEASALGKQLDETKKALATAVDDNAAKVGELDKAGKQLIALQAELVETSKKLAEADKLLNEKTAPKPAEIPPATT